MLEKLTFKFEIKDFWNFFKNNFETRIYKFWHFIHYEIENVFISFASDIKNKRNGEYFTSEYGFVRFNKDSKIVELRDLTHFTIDLSKIFKINSDWNLFPENLKKHKLQIRKSIYKSLLESMIDRLEYYYSESNYFFG